MFLRSTRRWKDGKEHYYWSLVENRRCRGNRVVQHTVLYLGEINDSQRASWLKSIEAFDETRGSQRKLVGLILEDRGVLRSHQKVIAAGSGEGEITSGTFSPTLERSIAFARVPAGTTDAVQVDIRGKLLRARVVKPPFVRFGRPLIT